MSRPATERPVEEHMVTITRVVRQIKVAKKLGVKRKTAIVKHLLSALEELQQEVAK